MKTNRGYYSIVEGYGGTNITLAGALKGLSRSFDKNLICWCNESADERIKLRPEGQCFYEQKCADCDINKINRCQQYFT